MKLNATELKELIDGELPETDAQRMNQEMDEDSRREMEFMKALGDEIRGLAKDHPIQGAEATLDRVRRVGPATKKGFPWSIAALCAASVMGLVIVFPMLTPAMESAKKSRGDVAMERAEVSKMPVTGESGGSVMASPPSERATFGEAEFRRQVPTRGGYVNGSSPSNQWYSSDAKGGGGAPLSELDKDAGMMAKSSRAEGREILNQTRGAGANTSSMTTSEAHQFMKPQLIRSADMSVGVKSAMESRDQLQQLVESWGGFVINSNVQANEKESNAYLMVRVPEFNFEKALTAIRGMGKLLSESSQGQDVTAEVVDSKSRVEVLADEEALAVKRLEKARTDSARAAVRAELRSIRMQLQSYKAQVKSLTELTKYSSITVNLKQTDAGWSTDSWSGDAYGEASGILGQFGMAMGRFGIFALVLIPVWLPLAIAGYLFWRRSRV